MKKGISLVALILYSVGNGLWELGRFHDRGGLVYLFYQRWNNLILSVDNRRICLEPYSQHVSVKCIVVAFYSALDSTTFISKN